MGLVAVRPGLYRARLCIGAGAAFAVGGGHAGVWAGDLAYTAGYGFCRANGYETASPATSSLGVRISHYAVRRLDARYDRLSQLASSFPRRSRSEERRVGNACRSRRGSE